MKEIQGKSILGLWTVYQSFSSWLILLLSWGFATERLNFGHVRSDWLLWGHMTTDNINIYSHVRLSPLVLQIPNEASVQGPRQCEVYNFVGIHIARDSQKDRKA